MATSKEMLLLGAVQSALYSRCATLLEHPIILALNSDGYADLEEEELENIKTPGPDGIDGDSLILEILGIKSLISALEEKKLNIVKRFFVGVLSQKNFRNEWLLAACKEVFREFTSEGKFIDAEDIVSLLDGILLGVGYE